MSIINPSGFLLLTFQFSCIGSSAVDMGRLESNSGSLPDGWFFVVLLEIRPVNKMPWHGSSDGLLCSRRTPHEIGRGFSYLLIAIRQSFAQRVEVPTIRQNLQQFNTKHRVGII
jgi:hypothetical protein